MLLAAITSVNFLYILCVVWNNLLKKKLKLKRSNRENVRLNKTIYDLKVQCQLILNFFSYCCIQSSQINLPMQFTPRADSFVGSGRNSSSLRPAVGYKTINNVMLISDDLVTTDLSFRIMAFSLKQWSTDGRTRIKLINMHSFCLFLVMLLFPFQQKCTILKKKVRETLDDQEATRSSGFLHPALASDLYFKDLPFYPLANMQKWC